MEIAKKGKFVTDFYGSRPALGYEGVLSGYIETSADKALLSMAGQAKKKGEKAIETLERILSVCHRSNEGWPVIGNWMFSRCYINTCQAFFNARENKNHPKQSQAKMALRTIQPYLISMNNEGIPIIKPDGVQTYAMGKGFFKAYEYVKAGAEFELTFDFDSDVLKEEHRDYALNKMCLIGVGAFRERFGKWVWV